MSVVAARPKSRLTLGLVLIVIGLVLTLDSAGVLKTGGLLRWWPLFLIGVGVVKVRQPPADGQRAAGIALLLLGAFFQLTGILAFGLSWPLILIGMGAYLLWQGIEDPVPSEVPMVSDAPYVSDMALMGYMKRSLHAPDFRGGSVTAVMGGVELDLRKAVIGDGGTAYLDVVAFWGGIELKVPVGWTVDARVVPLMGGFENKVDPLSHTDGARLVVRGHAIMGVVVVGH